MTLKSSFAPVVAPDTRVLVLGSLPGEASLAAGRYYANPRNQFWRLIGSVIGVELHDLTYDDRLAALRRAGVGLWDTVGSATRQGSLDAAIRDATANDLAGLVATLPQLRCVAFNGAKAAAVGRAQLPQGFSAETLTLPSSSPAHARAFALKEAAWLALGRFLGPAD